jgi:predicted XRE-type DNA-binding protein
MAQDNRHPIDLDAVHQLQAQGISQREIARRLRIPKSTLHDAMKRSLPAKSTDVLKGRSTQVHKSGLSTEVHNRGATKVHIDLPLADLAEFQEVLAWWRRRKHLLSLANETPTDTERWTLHIERSFIAKIKAEAEAEHVTVTEVINRIIRHYYAGG